MFDETDDDLRYFAISFLSSLQQASQSRVLNHRNESLKSLALIAQYRPDMILEHTVPSLVAELPEHPSEIGVISPGQTSVGYERVLSSLEELAIDPVLFD